MPLIAFGCPATLLWEACLDLGMEMHLQHGRLAHVSCTKGCHAAVTDQVHADSGSWESDFESLVKILWTSARKLAGCAACWSAFSAALEDQQ